MSVWCAVLGLVGIVTAECGGNAGALGPVPEVRGNFRDLYDVPPAAPPPPPVVAPAAQPQRPGLSWRLGALSVQEGQALPLGGMVAVNGGDRLELRAIGAVHLRLGEGTADAGVPVAVGLSELGGIAVEGSLVGSGGVEARASGPGGVSDWVQVPVMVTAAPAVARPPPAPDPAELRRGAVERILNGLGEDWLRQRGRTTAEIGEVEGPAEPEPKRDKDYARLGLKEDKSGYPVDRTRRITADRYITGTLVDRVNSQLGGRLIVQLDRPVFGADGWLELLPSGTRVVCTYKPLQKEGDTRLDTECKRAIRPDGASIVMTELITGDQSGSTGLVGNVDNRTWERYGAAFVSASIGALAAVGSNQQQMPVVLQQGSARFTDSFADATQKILERNIDLAPIITIPAGSRVTLMPTRDIYLIE